MFFLAAYGLYVRQEMGGPGGEEEGALEPLKFQPSAATPSKAMAIGQTLLALVVIFAASRVFVAQLEQLGPPLVRVALFDACERRVRASRPGSGWRWPATPVSQAWRRLRERPMSPMVQEKSIMRNGSLAASVLALFLSTPTRAAPNWAAVDQALGRPGTEQAGGVHRYGFPRSDLAVTLDGVSIKPALALGSWRRSSRWATKQWSWATSC